MELIECGGASDERASPIAGRDPGNTSSLKTEYVRIQSSAIARYATYARILAMLARKLTAYHEASPSVICDGTTPYAYPIAVPLA